MISEIKELLCFVEACESDKARSGQEVILRFGPDPGSFFADDCRTRYCWAKLPFGLEHTLQKIVCIRGYGKISDVAINAAGGWVVQLKDGADYEWGGQLPDRLHQALENGKKRKASIKVLSPTYYSETCANIVLKRLYLNHQHESEYVLIFKDGKTCICLHAGFEQSFKSLVTQAIRGKVEWDFQQSCHCDEGQQQQINAAYYNRRGRFQLCREADEQALSYLKEAVTLDNTQEYLDDYGMALIAVRIRRQDSILEDWLASDVESADHQRGFHNPEDKHYIFRNEYLRVIGKQGGSFERLLARLQEVIRLGDSPYWSYSMGTCVYELPQVIMSSPEDSTNARAELPGNVPDRRNEVELDSGGLPSIVATNPMMQRRHSKLKMMIWR